MPTAPAGHHPGRTASSPVAVALGRLDGAYGRGATSGRTADRPVRGPDGQSASEGVEPGWSG
ncbi:hypothetical protein ACFQMA_02625 [Halosimplex aquaticum]|uniref:Uncharacterized protein n=1 Tax=Halosimplex aquaticum TaxID=3026162 RepID=A0ABD5Y086_9EURY|nr:hypothetical protein [Halosimplex aquaticum]